jgi:hypothetical protein
MATEKDRTGVIDVIAHDPKTGEAVLVMNEPNEWDSSDEQLLSLQERFNAYVSFLLDGEMERPSGTRRQTGADRIALRAHAGFASARVAWCHIHDQLA